MVLVADTTFLIDAAHQEPDAKAKLESLVADGEALVAPTVVAAEFLDHTRDPRAALGELREAVRLAPFTIEDAVCAAEIARELRDRGAYPGRVDCLIAGFARSRGGLGIVTRNTEHFPASTIVEY